MFGLPGGTEWILLVLIVLLLFGSARLPRLARSMREAREEFKKESAGAKEAAAKEASSGGSAVPEAQTENPEPAQAASQGEAPDPPA